MKHARLPVRAVFSLILALVAASPAVAADIGPRGWSFSALSGLPVQAGGRIKPLDSYARDTVLMITGKRVFQGWDPTELLVSWLAHPKEWATEPFIQITRKDVKRQLGLDEERSRFSPQEVLSESFLAQYAQELESAQKGLSAQATPIAKTSKSDGRQDELKRLVDRITLYRAIVTGHAWPVVPVGKDGPWETLAMPADHGVPGAAAPSAGSTGIRESFLKVFGAYLKGEESVFHQAVGELRGASLSQVPGWSDGLGRRVSAEHFYNRFDPLQWAWILYLLAAILWSMHQVGAANLPQAARLKTPALVLTFAGFALHVFAMAIRSYISGRPPVTNMYESIVWVAFGILLFAIVLWWIQKNTALFGVAAALGAIALIVSDAAPAIIDPSIHPLVPVLRSNYWLTIHVLTITLSYGAFALSMGLSNVSLWHYFRGHDQREAGAKKIATLNLLSYRGLQFGVVLLAAGTILGGVWADYSWGRFWGWDPKEVWALIAFLGYTIVLHARLAGWLRPFGFAAWTVISFALVLMAWYGVNFVLGVGLHSYGFSTGGQGFVGLFVLAQFLFVGVTALRHRRLASSSHATAS